MSLKLYKKKRDFKKTPEPKGKVQKTNQRIFIIQKHAASHLHYDFRIELNGVLLSWAVPKGPCLDPKVKRLAMHVEDHPIEYASFEGIIPAGEYGAGTVMLWDKGIWISHDTNPTQAYKAGDLTFELRAKKLKGLWKLIRMKATEKSWLLMKIKDEYAQSLSTYDITEEEPLSVKSGKDLEEIAENFNYTWSKSGLAKAKKTKKIGNKKKIIHKKFNLKLPVASFPNVIYPQLATLVSEPPEGKTWLHEIKLDGYRLIAFKQGRSIRLMTRNNNDWTNQFKVIKQAMEKIPINQVILDGEVVVLDDHQHSNFQLLQNSMKVNQGKPFIYFIFDLLYYDKWNLMDLPLIERKSILAELLKSVSDLHLRYSDHLFGPAKKILAKTCELGLEGIVSKAANSPYIQKRSSTWLKTKCLKRQEFVIAGFTPPQGARSYFGSLLLGTYNKKKQLIYNGNVGTGFTEVSLKSIYNHLQKYILKEMPFGSRPPGSKNVTWLKPVLVAEVEFSSWTKDDIVRHPSFKGLRSDKPARTITKEIPKTPRK